VAETAAGVHAPQGVSGFHCRRLRAGEVLITEGQPLGSLAFVQSGAIVLSITGHGGRRGVVGVVGPGDILGEEGLRRGEDGLRHPRFGSSLEPSSSRPVHGGLARPEARALTVCAIQLVPLHDLDGAVRRDPSLADRLSRSLTHRLAELQVRLGWALSVGVHERILSTLQLLAHRWGSPVPSGTRVDLPLSQELLATMVGASRETVNRALRELRATGAVLRSGRHYVVAESSGWSGSGRDPGSRAISANRS
jgi:CRP-like cAMP-binding protein